MKRRPFKNKDEAMHLLGRLVELADGSGRLIVTAIGCTGLSAGPFNLDFAHAFRALKMNGHPLGVDVEAVYRPATAADLDTASFAARARSDDESGWSNVTIVGCSRSHNGLMFVDDTGHYWSFVEVEVESDMVKWAA